MTTESRNHLSAEKSPYLLQHQNNPVHWYPWGQEAFDAAGREDKPIFLSIGYSTCYWCHVMEHDSFERQDVADVLNRDFICIKVDREERPDVDHIYMDVVVAMHGHGGWPMSVFLTPDRKPFWGGTFFWRQQFLQVLQGVQKAWSRDRDKVISSAEQITEAVADREISSGAGAASKQILEEAAHKLHSSYDPRFGGFGPAPKFPPTQQLRFLLRWHRRKEDSSALEMATHTVDCMIRGGLYDHIGGGFARYSTDERWLVPHFEKMLYDNALLAETLVEMYQVTGKEYLAATLKELLDFVAREMRSAEGGFLSAIDAGEVDKEGEFYVWKLDELERLLTPDELAWTRHLFDITEAGNFEGQANVLSLRPDCPWEDRFSRRTELLREKLLAARSTRRNPHVDDKCLASWNGLMIGAFAKAARVLKVDRYLQIAEEAAAFIKDSLLSEGKLSRRFREGAVLPYAFVDDYAYVISGLLALYESNFDEEILLWAKCLQAEFDALLWDESKSLYRTSAAPELIVQKFELFDGATPSANSVAYGNLMRLSGYFPEDRFDLKADRVGKALAAVASQYPHGFSRFLIELDFALPPMREIAIIIRPDERFEQNDLVQLLWRKFIPGKIVAVAHAQRKSAVPILQTRELLSGRAAAYVCRGQQCELPVSSAAELERMLALDTPERGNPDRGNPARGDRA